MALDIRKAMLEEFDLESSMTRLVLQATPDEELSAQPAENGHTIRWNLTHLADIPDWCDVILSQPYFDVTSESPADEVDTVATAIKRFDDNVLAARDVIEDFDVDGLDDPWVLKAGSQEIMKRSRYMIYRLFMISHVAHHRGHVLAYLRAEGIEVPLLYGG